MRFFEIYLIVINVITFFTYGIDKYLAIKNKKRISEKKLLTMSLIGGCYLGICAMYFFHHKTLKMKFKIVNLGAIIFYTYIIIKYVA